MASPMVWFVTGVSAGGLGRFIARAALARGHTVVGTVRSADQMDGFEEEAPGRAIAYQLDVTSSEQIQEAVARAARDHGRIDVAVNNAGQGLLAALEETDDARMERSVATNFLGPLRVMRSVIPVMRQQGQGHIINITAIAGVDNHEGFSVYGGSKAALDVAGDAVAAEVKPFGIKVTSVVPGPVRTPFIARNVDLSVTRNPAYAQTVGKFATVLSRINGKQPGDPAKCAEAILAIAGQANAPARLVLGKYGNDKFRKKLAALTQDSVAWEHIGLPTDK